MKGGLRLSDYLERHRAAKGAALLLRRYFDHHVGRDSAALTYYLLFALFPLLIFLNNLLALWALDLESLLREFSAVVPRDILDLTDQYLRYLSRTSSRALLWFSLVFTIYFPYRAVNALFQSVRKAYDAGAPQHFLRYQFRALLYTVLLIVTIFLSIAVSSVGGRALEFVSNYIRLSGGAVYLWTRLRFVFLGAVLFAMIALLYALSLDERRFKSGIWPGGAGVARGVGGAVHALLALRGARGALLFDLRLHRHDYRAAALALSLRHHAHHGRRVQQRGAGNPENTERRFRIRRRTK